MDIERIRKLIAKRARFTVEHGRGETYHDQRPTLYSHTIYPRHSVLAGQPCRTYIESWANWAEAEAAIVAVQAELPSFKPTMLKDGGDTFIDADTLMDRAGVPHDDDY